ncbi:MAG: exodeoxyribonuclease VII small subunit [Eubacteriales bacterium]|nr:exodeoxyribonuclease VII small subunit [Eubacteriales bacterium]
MSIEEAFSALQELLGQMESGEIPLEESFALYERGMRLVQYCNTRIDRVEKQVQQISEEGTLEPFV